MVLKALPRRPINFPIEVSGLTRIPSVWHRLTWQGIGWLQHVRKGAVCGRQEVACAVSEGVAGGKHEGVTPTPLRGGAPPWNPLHFRGGGKRGERGSEEGGGAPGTQRCRLPCLYPRPPSHLFLDLQLLHCLLLTGLSFFLPSFAVPSPFFLCSAPSFALTPPSFPALCFAVLLMIVWMSVWCSVLQFSTSN